MTQSSPAAARLPIRKPRQPLRWASCVADNPMRASPAPRSAPASRFQRQRQMGAALVARNRVNLIHDQPCGRWQASRVPTCETPTECTSDSGVVTTMCGALRLIPGAPPPAEVSPVRTHCTNGHLGADSTHRQFLSRMPSSGALEIALDVIRQSLERRHVKRCGSRPAAVPQAPP